MGGICEVDWAEDGMKRLEWDGWDGADGMGGIWDEMEIGWMGSEGWDGMDGICRTRCRWDERRDG